MAGHARTCKKIVLIVWVFWYSNWIQLLVTVSYCIRCRLGRVLARIENVSSQSSQHSGCHSLLTHSYSLRNIVSYKNPSCGECLLRKN